MADKANFISHNAQDHEQAISWLTADEHFEKIVEKSMAKLNKVIEENGDEEADDEPFSKKYRSGSYSVEYNDEKERFKEMGARTTREHERISFRSVLPASVNVFECLDYSSK